MLKIIEEIDLKKWENLSESSSYTNFFQTKDCYDFYASLSFLKPFALGVEEMGCLKGVVCGYIIADRGLLKQYFSCRAVIQGGVLIADDISRETLSFFLAQIKFNLNKKGVIYIEFRNNADYSIFKDVFNLNGFDYKPHYNYIVKTNKNIDEIIKNISKSKKRQVRKAKAQGVVVVEVKKQEEIDGFYTILEELYESKVKKPLFPKEFFEKLITLPTAKIFVAKYKTKIIGGMACVFDQETVYEWFVCGEDEKYKHLYPSVISTYSVIEYAVKNGFSYFDFMGAGRPNKYYGVREFKEKFGGELVEWGRYLYINKKTKYFIGKMGFILLNIKK